MGESSSDGRKVVSFGYPSEALFLFFCFGVVGVIGQNSRSAEFDGRKTYDRYQRNDSGRVPAARQENNLFVCIFRNSDTRFFDKNKEQSSSVRM